MVAQPASVPAVRRFVDEVLTTWCRDDLVDDIALSVTELATNATLHSQSTFFDVGLRLVSGAVHVEVVDAGAMPAQSIALRVGPDSKDADDPDLDYESMTGRGLFIVSALASRWGIDDLPGGTRVWADFAVEGSEDTHVNRQPLVSVTAAAAYGPDQRTEVIELLGCPPDLLLAHDDNLADIARELRLYGASHRDPEARAIAERISEIVRLSALSWDAARVVAKQAVHDGERLVDIAIATDPEELTRRVSALRQAVLRAEAMAEEGLLMTMPAAAPVQEWRDWVEVEMVEQATTGRAPVPYADHRAPV